MPSLATGELGELSVLTGHKQNWGSLGKEEGEWKPVSSVCERVRRLEQVVHHPKGRGRVLFVPVPLTAAGMAPGTWSAELNSFRGALTLLLGRSY